MSRRLEKVAAVLQQHAATVIAREYSVSGTAASVVSVDVSPDLKNATVWVSIYGKGSDELKARIEASAAGLIARSILHTASLRSVPKIKLNFDHSAEHAEKIARILSNLKND